MVGRHDIPMALRAAYRLMHRETGGWLANHGVTADQFVLLSLLEGEDGITQQELVRRASSDPNTVRAMLVILEKGELIRRESHPEDRRALSVSLTRKGETVYQSLEQMIHPLQDEILGLFEPREAAELVDLLSRISQSMGRSRGPNR